MSKTYALKFVQNIPCTLDEAWRFFSDPQNLVKITPPDFSFKVTSKFHGDKLYPGQIIEYIVKPLLGIPMYWMTEITHVKDKEFFVDEQRYGPYSLWHHQHLFKEIEGGVQMTDIVHYKVPMWFLGDFANAVLVRKKLQHVFNYRFKTVKEIFGNIPDDK
jgi:ligand-binding SRPBCC domain-containing protein